VNIHSNKKGLFLFSNLHDSLGSLLVLIFESTLHTNYYFFK